MTNIINPEFEIRASDSYISLLEDCKSTLTEKFVTAQTEMISARWSVGRRIFEENNRMEREKIYGQKIIETLAEDLNTSVSNLHFMVQFYRANQKSTFEEVISQFPKDITWHKIITQYLGERQKLPPERKVFHRDIITKALLAIGLSEEKIKHFFEILKSYVKRNPPSTN